MKVSPRGHFIRAIALEGCKDALKDTVIESALKVDPGGGEIPWPQWGIKYVSAACRSDALPTEGDADLALISMCPI